MLLLLSMLLLLVSLFLYEEITKKRGTPSFCEMKTEERKMLNGIVRYTFILGRSDTFLVVVEAFVIVIVLIRLIIKAGRRHNILTP